VDVPARIRQISAGYFHTCALDEAGKVWCWGKVAAGIKVTAGGAIGNTELPDRPEYQDVGKPYVALAAVSNLSPNRSIASALSIGRACAVRDQGIQCWDTGGKSLGSEPSPNFGAFPVAAAEQLAIAPAKSCAIVRHGGARELECWWGHDQPKRAAWPASAAQPVEVTMGTLHLCARDARGAVYCWRFGVDTSWWLGLPQHIRGLTGGGAASVAAGGDFVCAACADGRVSCFLAEPEGLPDEVAGTAWAAPRADGWTIAGVEHARKVAAGQGRNVLGHGFACALLDDGSVQCWGDGDSGQLGDGSRVSSSPPVQAHLPP